MQSNLVVFLNPQEFCLQPWVGSGRIVASIAVGREPLAVAVGAGSIWVANTIDRTVSRIDPSSNRVTATIDVRRSPTAIAVAQGSVWVATDAS